VIIKKSSYLVKYLFPVVKFFTVIPGNERVYSVEDGKLYLKGIENPGIQNDPRPFLTGGVDSRGKFSFLYGKIEIRAKKECARGAWPAIWMMPEESVYGGWPHSGEIDIMEHLNYDSTIHHTVHSRYTNILNNRTDPPRGIGNIRADVTQWNVYGLEWYPDVLVWTLNGKETFRYPRVEGLDPDMIQWPFDQAFYIILSQQLGGSWVGEIKPEELPVSMIIDYVKVYQQ
jgi:beta-glucanase (GH16 family)